MDADPGSEDEPSTLMARAIINQMILDLVGSSPPTKARRQCMVENLKSLYALVTGMNRELGKARGQLSAESRMTISPEEATGS